MKFERIVCFPSIEWSHNWERQQELITRLAEKYSNTEIDIFEPLGLINHPLKVFVEKVRKRLLERVEIKSTYNNRKTDNMRFQSLNFIPFHYYGVIDFVNFLLLKKKIETSEALVWATYLNGFTFKAFKQAKYKILDLATRRQVNKDLSQKAKDLEIEGVKIADLIFVDNYNTYLDYEKYAKRIIYLPQGVDDNAFSEHNQASEYLYLRSSGKKIIGYCGTLHQFIDYDLLIKVIETLDEHIFMFVGNILDGKANELLKLTNVIFTGQKDHSVLGQYYRLFDVGLIPYTVEPYTSGVFPTKFFEYLINEVPVVSSPLPDLLRFEELPFLSIYHNHDEFVNSILQILSVEDQNLRSKMRSFSTENTWTKRFDQITTELNNL